MFITDESSKISYTYAKMNEEITRCTWPCQPPQLTYSTDANWGRQVALIKPGDVVALLMENRPEFIFIWLGLARLGAVTSFINTNLRNKALHHCMHVCDAQHYIVGCEHVQTVREMWREVKLQPKGTWYVSGEDMGTDFVYMDRMLMEQPTTELIGGLYADRTPLDSYMFIYTR